MSRNRYFSSKPKACLNSTDDVEMVLLKQVLRLAVMEGKCVSYDARIFMFASTKADADSEMVTSISRISEPNVAVDVRHENPARAVDMFVDQFIYETDLQIAQVSVHVNGNPDSNSRPWSVFLRLPAETLLDRDELVTYINE